MTSPVKLAIIKSEYNNKVIDRVGLNNILPIAGFISESDKDTIKAALYGGENGFRALFSVLEKYVDDDEEIDELKSMLRTIAGDRNRSLTIIVSAILSAISDGASEDTNSESYREETVKLNLKVFELRDENKRLSKRIEMLTNRNRELSVENKVHRSAFPQHNTNETRKTSELVLDILGQYGAKTIDEVHKYIAPYKSIKVGAVYNTLRKLGTMGVVGWRSGGSASRKRFYYTIKRKEQCGY